MELTAPDVSRVLDALLTGTMSREAAEDWASARLDGYFGNRGVSLTPGTDEHRLWQAVIFLSGVALQPIPGTYLHDKTDFAEFRARTGF